MELGRAVRGGRGAPAHLQGVIGEKENALWNKGNGNAWYIAIQDPMGPVGKGVGMDKHDAAGQDGMVLGSTLRGAGLGRPGAVKARGLQHRHA